MLKRLNQTNKKVDWTAFVFTVALLAIYKFIFHEFWKDEWQAWQVATTTPSMSALFKALPYEGHPSLWYLLLLGLHHLQLFFQIKIPDEYLITGLHFVIGILALYMLFVKFSMPSWMKLGAAFSYFVFFEYGVINRGYILVIALLFYLCILIQSPTKRPYLIAIALFLLTQTEVFGLLMAIAIVFLLFLQGHQSKQQKTFYIAIVALLIGIVCFVFTLISFTPEGNKITFEQLALLNTAGIISTFQTIIAGCFAPSLFASVSIWGLVISVIVLAGLLIGLRQYPNLQKTYLLFCCIFFVFTLVIYAGGPRQWGMHFVFLLFIIELCVQEKPLNNTFNTVIALILVLQLYQNCIILKKEKNFLFSNAIVAGRYIKNNVAENDLIIGLNKAYCTPVIGYSANHPCYTLPTGAPFTYFLWKEKMYVPTMQDIQAFGEMKQTPNVYVLSYRPLNLQYYYNLAVVATFDAPSIRQEDYFLYKLK